MCDNNEIDCFVNGGDKVQQTTFPNAVFGQLEFKLRTKFVLRN